MRGLRKVVSRLSMLAGVAMMVGGLGIRGGLLSVPGALPGGPGPAASAPVVVAVASTTPVVRPSSAPATPSADPLPTPSPSPELTPSPEPSTPTPALTNGPWFADEFDTVAAWPDGKLDWMTTSIRGGAYRIAARSTDLPVYAFAAAGEGAPTGRIEVAAELSIGEGQPASAVGIAIEDADGTRLAALVSADGRVTLLRDSFVQLDELASGSIAPPSGPVRLRLVLDGETISVAVDDTDVARASQPFAPIGFGLAVWAYGDLRAEVLRYEVRASPAS